MSKEEKKQTAADEAIRNTVEGKFGQGKRRFGLGRVMAKLASTSATQISLSFLVMNLELALRQFFFVLVLACHRLVARHTVPLGRSYRAQRIGLPSVTSTLTAPNQEIARQFSSRPPLTD